MDELAAESLVEHANVLLRHTSRAGNPFAVYAGNLATFAPAMAAPTSQIGGEFSLWGMGVIPTHGIDDSSACDAGGTEFCSGLVGGYGGQASVYVPLGDTWSFSGDMLTEFHTETNSNANNRDEPAVYTAIGLHFVNESNPDLIWGGFVFGANGSNHADNDVSGPVIGAGVEAELASFKFQVGGLMIVDPNDAVDDAIGDMIFVGVGRDFAFANGVISAGAMYGFGDFDEDRNGDSNDAGTWAQISLDYEAPLGNTGMNWTAGYQGDFVSVGEPSDVEEAMFHSVKLGISIPFGAGAGPFSTPNFRAPITNAGEME